MKYPKSFRNYTDLLNVQRQRGLIVNNENFYVDTLARVNYYRLSGYWYVFRQFDPSTGVRLDSFCPNVSFDHIYQIFLYDFQLRQICFEMLSEIEISLKTLFGHEIGRVSPIAHLDFNVLNPDATQRNLSDYSQWRVRYEKQLENSQFEDCVVHHKKYYGGFLPIWAAVEILDWGSLSKLYSLCSSEIKQTIVKRFDNNITSNIFYSWLTSLNHLRNLCAHQQRLWNRSMRIKPKKVTGAYFVELFGKDIREDKFYYTAQILQYFYSKISVLRQKSPLYEQFVNFPRIPYLSMGMMGAAETWGNDKIWQFTN
jgi:abortive infection bacteriophage resistance protein